LGPRPGFEKSQTILPREVAMWVYGDDNGLGALARFEDSTGQVFQNNGGVIHYPIKWHTLFLFQSIKQQKTSGVIYLSSPTIAWGDAIRNKNDQ
jgi:hypothetical protein